MFAPLSHAALDAIAYFRRPTLPAAYDYALLTNLSPTTKPIVFDDIRGLVRRIHRDRHDQALQLRNDRVMVRGEDGPRRVVAIYALDQVGHRTRFLGYAWLKGRDRHALEAALQVEQPAATVRRRAAACTA